MFRPDSSLALTCPCRSQKLPMSIDYLPEPLPSARLFISLQSDPTLTDPWPDFALALNEAGWLVGLTVVAKACHAAIVLSSIPSTRISLKASNLQLFVHCSMSPTDPGLAASRCFSSRTCRVSAQCMAHGGTPCAISVPCVP